MQFMFPYSGLFVLWQNCGATEHVGVLISLQVRIGWFVETRFSFWNQLSLLPPALLADAEESEGTFHFLLHVSWVSWFHSHWPADRSQPGFVVHLFNIFVLKHRQDIGEHLQESGAVFSYSSAPARGKQSVSDFKKVTCYCNDWYTSIITYYWSLVRPCLYLCTLLYI